ncbi:MULTISPECIES: DUF3618 domain-containing protein [Crossiella]|uniref:DUF3618 domain-containing protein n=1 Tax=Crossiella cryophila TaxID=43355 RepID=A0A7W7FT32_9PSEU|nr:MULTISPECIES: DUF3618 domain-containing protein [Crossiella]MBB4676013.1 hypothetical protein [Crossiella cryophila]MCK2244059.1 DUF3618 domain-containing protein [Crossiella sp. S99.2]MCK2257083.1 DUF3618 domain-containing protein [Crossiella sp. S99.1]
MARDPESIQRDIEQARDSLASTLDELAVRANPKKFVDESKAAVKSKLDDPRVKYSLIAFGALVVLALLRKIFR